MTAVCQGRGKEIGVASFLDLQSLPEVGNGRGEVADSQVGLFNAC